MRRRQAAFRRRAVELVGARAAKPSRKARDSLRVGRVDEDAWIAGCRLAAGRGGRQRVELAASGRRRPPPTGESSPCLGLREQVEHERLDLDSVAEGDAEVAGAGEAVDADSSGDLHLGLLHVEVARPTMTSTWRTVSVPWARAAIAWAPPMR
jgi:hypothetical protein